MTSSDATTSRGNKRKFSEYIDAHVPRHAEDGPVVEEVDEQAEKRRHDEAWQAHTEFNRITGACAHRVCRNEQRQPFIRSCSCHHKRYCVCSACNSVIDLRFSSGDWPYACVGPCQKPLCVGCANCALPVTSDAGASALMCNRCVADTRDMQDTRLWSAVLRVSRRNVDGHVSTCLEPAPLLGRTRNEAASGALEFLKLHSPYADECVASLVDALQKQHSGWVSSRLCQSKIERVQVDVGLFPLHAPGRALLGVPELA